jgi:hypothetical protein
MLPQGAVPGLNEGWNREGGPYWLSRFIGLLITWLVGSKSIIWVTKQLQLLVFNHILQNKSHLGIHVL